MFRALGINSFVGMLCFAAMAMQATFGFAGVQIRPEGARPAIIEINVAQRKAGIGGMFLPVPMLLELDAQRTVTAIHVSGEDEARSLASVFAGIEPEREYAWIDDCDLLAVIAPNIQSNPDQNGICMIAGQRGYAPSQVELAVETTLFEFARIGEFPPATEETSIQNYRARNLQTLVGDIALVLDELDGTPGFRGILLRSAGYQRGRSYIRNKTWDSLQSGDDTTLPPGFSLSGITADGEVELLDSVFDCDPDFDLVSVKPWSGLVADAAKRFSLFVAMVHDSGSCRQDASGLSGVFGNLPLREITKTGFRRPYVGVFSRDAVLFEGSNSAFDRLSVYLQGRDIADPRWIRAGQNPLAGVLQVKPLEFAAAKIPEAELSPVSLPTEPVIENAEEKTEAEVEQPVSPPNTGRVSGPLQPALVENLQPVQVANLPPKLSAPAQGLSQPVTQMATNPATPSAEGTGIANCGSDSAGTALPCCAPSAFYPVGTGDVVFSTVSRLSLAEAVDAGFVALRDGWLPQTAGGYFIGKNEAVIRIKLPAEMPNITLAVEANSQRLDWLRGISWGGKALPRQLSGDFRVARFDASDLPRGREIELVLSVAPEGFACRTDATGNMILAASLVRSIFVEESNGFKLPELVLRHDGSSPHTRGSYQWLEAVKTKGQAIELDLVALSDGKIVCSVPSLETPINGISGNAFRSRFSKLANGEFACDLDGLAGWLRTNRDHKVFFDADRLPQEVLAAATGNHSDIRQRLAALSANPSRIPALATLELGAVMLELNSDNAELAGSISPRNLSGIVVTPETGALASPASSRLSSIPTLLRTNGPVGALLCRDFAIPPAIFAPESEAGAWDPSNQNCS